MIKTILNVGAEQNQFYGMDSKWYGRNTIREKFSRIQPPLLEDPHRGWAEAGHQSIPSSPEVVERRGLGGPARGGQRPSGRRRARGGP